MKKTLEGSVIGNSLSELASEYWALGKRWACGEDGSNTGLLSLLGIGLLG